MSKKITIGIVMGIAAIVAIFAIWKIFLGGTGALPALPSQPVVASPANGITKAAIDRSAYSIALARAVTWEPDAALFKMVLTDASGGAWDFTFVSAKTKGVGFEIVVVGQNILSAEATAITGGGAVLPANVISPDQAIAQAHAIQGYGDALIVSVEMIYNAAARTWYWGVKTASGTTVTIKATP